jgi:hypothetical protein
MLHGIIHPYCIKKRTLKLKETIKKINSNPRSYLKNPSNFNAPWFLGLVSKFLVFTLFREFMKFPTTLIFRVSFNLVSFRPKFRS